MAKRPNNPDYEVGYARPPRSGQFKPGQSGNPKGRPSKNKDIQEIINDTLFSRVTIRENGRARTATKLEVFMIVTLKAALSGDPAASARLIRLLPLATKAQAAETAAAQAEDREDTSACNSALEREMLKHFVEMVQDGTFVLDVEDDE